MSDSESILDKIKSLYEKYHPDASSSDAEGGSALNALARKIAMSRGSQPQAPDDSTSSPDDSVGPEQAVDLNKVDDSGEPESDNPYPTPTATGPGSGQFTGDTTADLPPQHPSDEPATPASDSAPDAAPDSSASPDQALLDQALSTQETSGGASKMGTKSPSMPSSLPTDAQGNIIISDLGGNDNNNMRAALMVQNQNTNNANMNKALQQITAGLTRTANPSSEYSDSLIKQAQGVPEQYKAMVEDQKNDPNSQVSKDWRAILKQMHVNISDKSSAANIEKVAPLVARQIDMKMQMAARAQQAEENRAMHTQIAQMQINGRSDLAQTKQNAAQPVQMQKLAQSMTTDINPNKVRSGNLAKTQAVVNASERINTLFNQFPDGNIPDNQTYELATATAALLGGGTVQGQEQIKHMMPTSAHGDAMKAASWLTGNPLGLEQQKFIKLLRTTAEREGHTAGLQVKNAQVQALAPYGKLQDGDPKTYNRILSSFQIDPNDIDEKGRYVPYDQAFGGKGVSPGSSPTASSSTGSSSNAGSQAQDPTIAGYASSHGLDYGTAQRILQSRGYGQ